MRKTITPDDLHALRMIFTQRIEAIDPERKAGLTLSGGTDSLTILLAMISTGRSPECFTFFVEGVTSSDLLASRHICKVFKLPLHEIMIPRDHKILIHDIQGILPFCENTKKTVIQCMHPWGYLYPEIQKKTSLVLNGLGGDDLYCNQRKVMVALDKYGETAPQILSMRKVYSDDLNFSAANIIRYGKTKFSITNIDFYNTRDIESWFLQFEIRALHKPFEKFPSVQAFRPFYDKHGFYRHHSSYQINSGLKTLHEGLLKMPINTGHWKDVRPIYEKIKRGI